MPRKRKPKAGPSAWKAQRNREMLYRFVVHGVRNAELAEHYHLHNCTTRSVIIRESCRLLGNITGDQQLPFELLRQAIIDRQGTAAKLRMVLALSPGEVERIVKALPNRDDSNVIELRRSGRAQYR